MLSTLCEPNKICLWARFGLWFTSLQNCLSKEVRSVLVLLPFLFFLTTFFFRFLEFPEADGLDWPVLFSWGNSLFLTMVVTPDPGARGHVSYVIGWWRWLNLLVFTFLRGQWSGLVEISQMSLRQGQSIMVTSQNWKIHHLKFSGMVTKYSSEL